MTATADNVDRHLDMLRGAIRSFGGKVEVAEVQAGRAVVKYKVRRAWRGCGWRCAAWAAAWGRVFYVAWAWGAASFFGPPSWRVCARRACAPQGPPAIGKGVSAAIRERFPEIREVVLADF